MKLLSVILIFTVGVVVSAHWYLTKAPTPATHKVASVDSAVVAEPSPASETIETPETPDTDVKKSNELSKPSRTPVATVEETVAVSPKPRSKSQFDEKKAKPLVAVSEPVEKEIVPTRTEPALSSQAPATPVVAQAPAAAEPKAEPEPVERLTIAEEPVREPEVIKPLPELAEVKVPAAPAPTPVLATQPVDVPGSDFKSGIWLALGAGFGYTSLKQDVQNISNLNAGDFEGPSAYASAGAWVTPRWGGEVSYQNVPGKMRSSPTITVQGQSYRWQSLAAEVLYHFNQCTGENSDEWIARAGVVQHALPFILTQSSSEIRVEQNTLTNIAVGLTHKHPLNNKTRFEWMIRYQMPIAATTVAGASIDTTAKVALDASAGVFYKIGSDLSVGGVFSTQYLNYGFKYQDSSNTNSGQQTLMQSNVGVRLVWEF